MSKFKAGDLVYCPSISPDVLEVLPVDDWQMKKKTPIRLPTINDDIVLFLTELGVDIYSKMPVIIHATQENYELLSKLYPNVTFEPPPKRKEPREIILAMLKTGYPSVTLSSKENYELFLCDETNINEFNLDDYFIVSQETGLFIIDFVGGEVVLGGVNNES